MDRTQRRLYSLLLVLVVLQLFTIGLLITRTGGVPEVASEPFSVTETVSQVESLMKPMVQDVGGEVAADTASAREAAQAGQPDSLGFRLPIRVEILNGCGVRGIGRRIASVVRERGFDVREVGNADHFRYDHTLVLDRTEEIRRALALADTFGIDHAYVRTEPDVRLVDIDVTLIIGGDHKALKFDLGR